MQFILTSEERVESAAADYTASERSQTIGLIPRGSAPRLHERSEYLYYSAALPRRPIFWGNRRHAYYLWIQFWHEVGKLLGLTAEDVNYLVEVDANKGVVRIIKHN